MHVRIAKAKGFYVEMAGKNYDSMITVALSKSYTYQAGLEYQSLLESFP